MFAKKQIGLLAVALVSVSLCGTAIADGVPDATANLGVSAGIDSQCVINSVTDLAFGDYRPTSDNLSAALTGNSGRVTVTCTIGSTAPKILLGQGINAVGGSDAAPARRLSNGRDTLAYFLYQDTAHTVWGNTIGTGKAVPTPDGNPHEETIYGEVAAGQNMSVGQYADIVVVSVTF